jgi:hypothetical protein
VTGFGRGGLATGGGSLSLGCSSFRRRPDKRFSAQNAPRAAPEGERSESSSDGAHGCRLAVIGLACDAKLVPVGPRAFEPLPRSESLFFEWLGYPARLCLDNGSEFVALALAE